MIEPPRHLFEGLRVLDLTRVMSGPFCTAMLADLGADVIKIEMPGFGEEGRHFAPHVNGESAYFALLNRGKRSITVNLKSPEGIRLIHELAAQSDVLVENFRPGVMDRLGIGQAQMRAVNPRLIYASISGFGQDGPFRDWPAFDLVIQAMSGLMSVTGERDGRAIAVGESIADVATGMFAAWGIAAALYDRERTGKRPLCRGCDAGFRVRHAAHQLGAATVHGAPPGPRRQSASRDLPGRQLPDQGRRHCPGRLFRPIFHRLAQAIGQPQLVRRSAFHAPIAIAISTKPSCTTKSLPGRED